MRPLRSRRMLQGIARLPVGVEQLAGVPVHAVVLVTMIDLAKCLSCSVSANSAHSPRRASKRGLPFAITRSR